MTQLPPASPTHSNFGRRALLFALGLGTAKLAHWFFQSAQNRQQFWRAWNPITRDVRDRVDTAIVDLQDDALQALEAPLETPLDLPDLPLNLPIAPTAPSNHSPTASPNAQPNTQPTSPALSFEPPAIPFLNPTPGGEPVRYESTRLMGVPFHRITIDLRAPETLLTIGLANNAPLANSSRGVYGDEPFANMVDRARAAAVVNGTFFGKDAYKRVLGNMIAGGRVLKYSPWENYGTTLGIKANRKLEMVTARADGKPRWQDHWFSLTCGPRLLRDGQIYLAPHGEGFRDPHVLASAYRCAIGYPKSGDELVLVNFTAPLSLEETADVMKAIGCHQAMNLDGGSSQALAYRGDIIVRPDRNLTNTIVVYDAQSPAPTHLYEARKRFERGARPDLTALR